MVANRVLAKQSLTRLLAQFYKNYARAHLRFCGSGVMKACVDGGPLMWESEPSGLRVAVFSANYFNVLRLAPSVGV